MEHAYRMTLGDVIYKDFFVPHTPGTFLIQEILILLFGKTLYPQIIYCCLISFLSYIITYNIISLINKDRVLNLILPLPVSITVMVQPSYDHDYVFFILLSSFLIIYAFKKGFPFWITILSGVIAVFPGFFKQNTGYAYLAVVNFVFIISVIFNKEKVSLNKYLLFFSGCLFSALISILYISVTSGLGIFLHSVFTIPYQIRLPEPGGFINIFTSNAVLRTVAVIILIYFALRYIKLNENWKILIGSTAFLTPLYIMPLFRNIILKQSFMEYFLTIWPVIIIILTILLLNVLRKRKDISLFIKIYPVVFIATCLAAFLSQGLYSTYQLYPVFIIMLIFIFLFVAEQSNYNFYRKVFIVNALVLTITVASFISYDTFFSGRVNFDDEGPVSYSTVIKGLALPGDYTMNFDNLIRVTNEEIPFIDKIIYIPHEDPFYWGSGRKPLFSLFMDDWVLKVTSADHIINKSKEDNVKWVILKTKLQAMGTDNFPNLDYLISRFKQEYSLYKTIPGYEIYKNKIN